MKSTSEKLIETFSEFVKVFPSLAQRTSEAHQKALSATAVARQARIYRKTLYGDFCRYES